MKWPRFSLRLMFAAVAVVAIVCAVGKFFSSRSIPKVPLQLAVRHFNASAQLSPVGALEPPLTEAEIISAIQAKLPSLGQMPKEKAILEQILSTKSIPADANLRFYDNTFTTTNGIVIVWRIDLDVFVEHIAAGIDKGYGLRIRTTPQPNYSLP